MMINAELQRHVWVELNWQRLLAAAGVLILTFLLGWFMDDYRFDERTATFAMTIFIITNYFYGSHLAGDALLQEVVGHTWDSQRLSAQSAWSLTWGKIIGSNLFVWAVSGVALIFIALAIDGEQVRPWGGLGWFLFKLMVTGLAFHGLSMLFGLMILRKYSQPSKSHYNSMRFLILFVLLSILLPFESAISHQSTPVYWYGISWKIAYFTLFSILMLLLWSWVGAWRLMGEELQLRQIPWVWAAFNLFAILYVGGVGLKPQEISWSHAFAVQGFWVVLTLAYGAAFMASKDPLLFRRMAQQWQASQGWARLVAIPCWLVSLALATVCLLLVLLVNPVSPWHVPWEMPMQGPLMDMMIWMDSKSSALSFYFFMLRDVGVMVWLNTYPNMRRSDAAIMVYFLVAYLLLPFLTTTAMGNSLLFIFMPQHSAPLAGIIAAFSQAAVVGLLLYGQHFWPGRKSILQ